MPKKVQMSDEGRELYAELKKLGKRANQRIVRLERAFGKDTWATRDLKSRLEIERLQAWTKSGRVKYNKSMSEEQMIATIKAVKNFLQKPTSTRRGIKKSRQKSIKTMQRLFSTDASKLTYEEAEALEKFFDDPEVNGITNYIPGSDVLALIETAREKKYEYETFYSQLKAYQKWNKGTGFDDLARKIYIKYVYKGNSDAGETDILFSNIIDMIENSKTTDDLEEAESIVENLNADETITADEYLYFINLIQQKRNNLI